MDAADGSSPIFSDNENLSPFWQSGKAALIVLFLALGLRLFSLGWPPFYIGIEELHTPSSLNYVNSGHFDPDNDYSSPFRKLFQYPLLKLLGDTATARRLPNAIFGALTAFFLVLLGRQLFKNGRIGVVAGFILATDPFHINFSRTTWEDVGAAMFLTAGLYLFAKALNQTEPDRYLTSLIAAGAVMSLAFATRRYVALPLLAIIILCVWRERQGPPAIRGQNFSRRLVFFLAIFGLLPFIAYFLTFYPWFARGYSLTEWISFQQYMVTREMVGVGAELSGFAKLYGHSYHAIDWFTKVVVFGFQMPVGLTLTSTVMIINNPFSWLLVWPSTALLVFYWRRTRSFGLIFALTCFFLLYLPFVVAKRQILIYSALPVLPTVFLILAIALEFALSRRRRIFRIGGAALLTAVLVTNLIFYPLAASIPLPKSWSAWLPFKSALMKPDELFRPNL